MPFALDALESARDPVRIREPDDVLSQRSRRARESVSPFVEATVPAASASTGASIAAPNPLSFRIDTTNSGKYTRRLVATAGTRPTSLSISAGGQTASFNVLGINGAELADAGWTANQFTRDSLFVEAGKYSWYTASGGDLKSPVISVPTTADTISLVFWTRYAGSGFSELPYGDVNLSIDGGTTFQRVMRLEGYAPIYYPEQVTIGGVKGKQVVFDFVPNGLPWEPRRNRRGLSHGTVTATPTGTPKTCSFRRKIRCITASSTSRGRSAMQRVNLLAYDFSGRLIWKANVTAGGNVAWDLNAGRVANGVYVVIARSGAKTLRLKLFIVRNGS